MSLIRRPFWPLLLVTYLLLMSGVTAGLWYGRQWSARTLGNASAQSQWEDFRQEVALQAQQGGPVQRQVPRSLEPPALVLLRDHFGSCLMLAVLLASALFATLTFFIRGVARQPKPDSRSRAVGRKPH
jgi:hypothetical protein